jgi:hypothetical protein
MTAGSGWTGVLGSVLAGGVLWPPGGGEMLPVAAGRDTESPGEGPAEGFRAAESARARGVVREDFVQIILDNPWPE